MPHSTLRKVFTVLALVTASTILAAPAQAGSRYCKVDHYHSGYGDTARTKAQARKSAGRAWSSFTAWEYGNHWGNIRLAMDTGYSCSQSTSGWQCSVTAKPCKISGRQATKYSKKARRVSRKRVRRSAKRTRTARRATAKRWSMKW